MQEKRKKHILFITNSTIRGGAEIGLKNFILELKKYPLNMEIVCPDRGEIKNLFSDLKIKEHEIYLGNSSIKFRGYNLFSPTIILHYLKLKKIIKQIDSQEKIDLIFCQQDPKEKILAAIIGEKMGIPVLWMEQSKLHPWQKYFHFRLLYRFFSKKVDRIIAVSKAAKKSFTDIDIDPQKIKVVLNGVRIKRLKKSRLEGLRKRWGLKNKIVFGTSCRLVYNKGLHELIWAAKEALEENKNLKFLIIGEGKEKTQLEKQAEKYQIKKYVKFAGFQKNAAALSELFDIVVSPSFDEGEGLPFRIVEGMAFAKPVITTDISGSKETVKNGISGYLIKTHQKKKLKDLILKLAENEELRKKMGRESKKVFDEQFNLKNTAKKLFAQIQKATERLPLKKPEKIRIIYYTDSKIVGGAERYLYLLLKNLDQKRFAPVLVCPGGENHRIWRKMIKNLGVKIFPIASRNLLSPRKVNPIYQSIKRINPTIIHLQFWSPYASGVGLLTSRLARVPQIFSTEHSFVPLEAAGRFLRPVKSLYHIWRKNIIDYPITVSLASKEMMKKGQCFKNKKIWVIHNGIDLEEIEKAKFKKHFGKKIPRDKINCLTVARLVEGKGHEVLIEALRFFKKEKKRIHLHFVGGGPKMKFLKNLTQKEGVLDIITFWGEHDNIPELLPHFDLFVFPSLTENFPFAVLEAMAASLPVISSNVGGIKEMIDEKRGGFLVKPNDPQALAKKISYFIKNKNERKRMGRYNFKLVRKKFSDKIMTERIENLYESAISQQFTKK